MSNRKKIKGGRGPAFLKGLCSDLASMKVRTIDDGRFLAWDTLFSGSMSEPPRMQLYWQFSKERLVALPPGVENDDFFPVPIEYDIDFEASFPEQGPLTDYFRRHADDLLHGAYPMFTKRSMDTASRMLTTGR